MKDKVLTFIIGFLVGAIVATGGFYIYENFIKKDMLVSQFQNGEQMPFNKRMDGVKPGEMPEDMQNEMPDNMLNGTDGQKPNFMKKNKGNKNNENLTVEKQTEDSTNKI